LANQDVDRSAQNEGIGEPQLCCISAKPCSNKDHQLARYR